MQSQYLKSALSWPLRKQLIDRAVEVLIPHVDQFDAVVFRGISGALVGPSIADRLEKDICVVRKRENSHSCYMVEGRIGRPFLIVDDVMMTGETARTILRAYRDCQQNPRREIPRCAGIYLYRASEDFTEDEIRQWLELDDSSFVILDKTTQ